MDGFVKSGGIDLEQGEKRGNHRTENAQLLAVGGIACYARLATSLVGLTFMLEPAGLMAPGRVMMRPVNDTAFFIPFVHAVECDRVPGFQPGDSGS